MNRSIDLLLLFYSSIALGMYPSNKQWEICPNRNKQYTEELARQKQNVALKKVAAICLFCDPQVLARNYILSEDHERDVRTIVNLNGYFDQGQHLVVMVISHVEHPRNFFRTQLESLADKAQELSTKLHDGAYSQEITTAWGPKHSGQSIAHWHFHVKNYKERPGFSLPEKIEASRNKPTVAIEDVFVLTKKELAAVEYVPVPFNEITNHKSDCYCCSVVNDPAKRENNLIIFGENDLKYNIVCLSHYPSLPAELSVIPKRHVSTIKDLSQEEFREHFITTMVLFPKVQEYAQEFIADCDGGNLCTKNIGAKGSIDEQEKHHVCTVIVPRTAIPITLGTLTNHSCKLDLNPLHFFNHMKAMQNELLTLINQ